MNKRNLKAAIEAGEFIVAPGLHDMIAALCVGAYGREAGTLYPL